MSLSLKECSEVLLSQPLSDLYSLPLFWLDPHNTKIIDYVIDILVLIPIPIPISNVISIPITESSTKLM